MGTRVEFYSLLPNGEAEAEKFQLPVTLRDDDMFFYYALIDDKECGVQVTDEDGETFIEIFFGPDEPDEVSLSYPFTTYDIPYFDDDSYLEEPAKLARVVHTDEAALPSGEFVFNSN